MKLITIANFTNTEDYNLLTHWWIDQALKFKGDLELEIWVDKKVENPIKTDRGTIIGKETFLLDIWNPNIVWDKKALHNIGFKLWNLCKETEPFIFIDLDAIIFQPLKHLVECSKDQSLIMVNHEKVEGHTTHLPYSFLNSGVQIVSDPQILNWKAILSTFEDGGCNYQVPGTDQAMLHQYLKHIGYDHTHPKVGHEWNHCAGLNAFRTAHFEDDLGNGPAMPDNIFQPVCINHYWYNFKPWQINCPFYKEFINGYQA